MKFPAIKTVVTSIGLLISHDASAQKMITFEGSSSSHSRSSREKKEAGKNSLNIGIASAINGYTPFYYERALGDAFGIQIGAGFTYRSFLNDFTQLIYEDGATTDIFNRSGTDVTDDYASYKFRKMRIGQYFSLSPRFYFHQEGMDGGYIGPMVEYKNYQYKVKMADETVGTSYSYDEANVPRTNKYMNEFMRCVDLTFQVGGHFQTRSHVSAGWSVGLGVRTMNAERLDIGITSDGTNDPHYSNQVHSYSATRPLFVFNFIMGGWF